MAIFVNQTSATINWLPPTITGDQVFYEVECGRTCEVDSKACTEEICGGDENTGFEFMNKSSGRTGLLSPFVNYTCKIMAKNRVSDFAARKHKVEASNTTVTFKTNGSGESVSLFTCDKPKSRVHCYYMHILHPFKIFVSIRLGIQKYMDMDTRTCVTHTNRERASIHWEKLILSFPRRYLVRFSNENSVDRPPAALHTGIRDRTRIQLVTHPPPPYFLFKPKGVNFQIRLLKYSSNPLIYIYIKIIILLVKR